MIPRGTTHDRRNTRSSTKDLTSDPVQIDYSLLLYCHSGCPRRYGDLYEGSREGRVEVVVMGTTNKQVLHLLFI